ncbi:hypothetical protein K402DRAFT_218779 [Aulographum hederae CBS 113979]|uniref:Rab-GAP TBC domain-containing protein n=1 Tax=Aulographum hederae CBS 113979 TaxID=1176131 RepID=A0A6G1GLM7_9PEZI|nr:hypothetical protein K402DRAFT_218779 [Aulographum hederae CBS 113979]
MAGRRTTTAIAHSSPHDSSSIHPPPRPSTQHPSSLPPPPPPPPPADDSDSDSEESVEIITPDDDQSFLTTTLTNINLPKQFSAGEPHIVIEDLSLYTDSRYPEFPYHSYDYKLDYNHKYAYNARSPKKNNDSRRHDRVLELTSTPQRHLHNPSALSTARKTTQLRIRPLMALHATSTGTSTTTTTTTTTATTSKTSSTAHPTMPHHHQFESYTSPGSPPDLTNSKSSKSSSFHSSSFAETQGLRDPTHFEDITLEDLSLSPSLSMTSDVYAGDAAAFARRNANADAARKEARGSGSSFGSNRSSGGHLVGNGGMRDLTNTGSGHAVARPSFPSLKRQVNGVNVRSTDTAGLGLALPGAYGRRVQQQQQNQNQNQNNGFAGMNKRSRSTSPGGYMQPFRGPQNHQLGFGRRASDRSISLTAASSSGMLKPMGRGIGRHPTWQPGRKSVKELEDEYNDEDEDVPDDAVIWNVPLSPRPPHERSASRSPDRDARTSADSDEMAMLQRSVTAPTTNAKNSMDPTARPSLQNGSVSASVVTEGRAKSWNLALSDLSRDAQDLTAALEDFAEQTAREHEERIQKGGASPPRRTKSGFSSTTVAEVDDSMGGDRPILRSSKSIALPPVRKGEIMIDPLPISKEKEALLTRTRPSWLPPKDQKEERRHLREYQRMMAHSLESEKRRASSQQQTLALRDTTTTSLTRIWETHVLPTWPASLSEPRTRELWWRGIPPTLRGEIWSRAVGNELGLTPSSYTAALSRARTAEAHLSTLSSSERRESREWSWITAIRRDASSAFPSVKVFKKGGPLHDSLIDLLMAWSFYRPDIGYIYGLAHPFALALLTLPSPPESFIFISNLFNRPLPLSFLLPDSAAIARTHALILATLRYKFPRLHRHLADLRPELRAEEFVEPLVRTLCTWRTDVEGAARVGCWVRGVRSRSGIWAPRRSL